MTQLPFLTALRFDGPDATTFLQGQLTADVRLLADGRTQLAAANTPQGRVVALLRLRQQGETVHALLPAGLAEPLRSQLKRYVLRAKVRIDEDRRTAAWLERDVPAPDGALVFQYDPTRRVALLPEGVAVPAVAPDAEARWRAADVSAGQPQVDAETSGQFVAHRSSARISPTRRYSSRISCETTSSNSPSCQAFNISYGGPLKKTPETNTFVSITTFKSRTIFISCPEPSIPRT